MNNFIKGFSDAFSGFSWILRPRIRRFVYIPLLINLVLFVGAFAVLRQCGSTWVSHWIGDKADWWFIFRWSYDLIVPVLIMLLYTTFLFIAYFLFSSFANLIGAPFNALLAKAVEKRLANEPVTYLQQPLAKEIFITIKAELLKLIRFIFITGLLLLLLLIPGVNLIFPVIWFIFMAYALSLQYIDYPMANHGHYYAKQRQVLKVHRMQRLGFGTAANLMLLIPVINFVAMPVCVCGATVWWQKRLFHQIEKL